LKVLSSLRADANRTVAIVKKSLEEINGRGEPELSCVVESPVVAPSVVASPSLDGDLDRRMSTRASASGRAHPTGRHGHRDR